MHTLKRTFIKHLLIFIFFLSAAIYVTYPLIFHLKDFSTGTGDELYMTWILNWNIHAFTTNVFDLFNANIFYPYHNSLAFSDPNLTSSLIALLPVIIFNEPLVANSINIILSFTLLGFFTYLLLFFITKDHAAGIIGGTLFGFSTYTLMKTMHLQLLSSYWIPLTILFFLKYLKVKKFHFFLLSVLCFYLQFLNSFLPAYFLLFILLILSIRAILKKEITIKYLINKKTIMFFVLLISAMIPIIYPYYHTSSSFNYTRDIRETIHTANRPEYLLYSFGRSKIAPIVDSIFYKHPGPYLYDGYRGFASLLLTIILLAYMIIKRKEQFPKYQKLFTTIAISMYILSLGPALQWGGKVIKLPFIIPLPYALFYYLAPGFKGFRNSGRLEFFEIFAFSLAIGIFISSILKGKKSILKSIITIFICALILGEFNFPMQFYKIKSRSEIPKVYNFIANNIPPDSVIAEFPIYNWHMVPYASNEYTREYYSTYHFRKTLNGAAGFSPPPWQETVILLSANFPDQPSIIKLKSIHIDYIIVHMNEFDKLNKAGYKINERIVPNSEIIQKKLSKSKEIVLISSFNEDKIYKIIY